MSSSDLIIGIDQGSPGGDHTARFWRMPSGELLLVPDYIPDGWLDRITPEWGPDRDGNLRWHLCWTGWNNGEGHAKVKVKGKAIYCHRDVVERVEGRKLSRWNYVDHRCERKSCLTYECLEAVPPGVNTRRSHGDQHQFKPAGAYLDTAPSPGTAWVEERFLGRPDYGDPLDGL